MKLPVSSWKKTLNRLGMKVRRVQSSSQSHLMPQPSKSRRRDRSSSSGYEVLEPRQLLAGDMTLVSVVDQFTDRAYQYSLDGDFQRSDSIYPSRNARGTAVSEDGSLQYVIDANKQVHVIDLETGHRVGRWRVRGIASPQGLAVDGTDLLVVDRARDRVFRFDQATDNRSGSQRPVSSFRLQRSNGQPTGITTDGNWIWIVDRADNNVCVYTTDGQLVGEWGLDSANRNPSGIAVDVSGDQPGLWVVDDRDNRVYYYQQGQNQTSGHLSATSSFRLRRFNRSAQGLVILPRDQAEPAAPRIDSIQQDTGPDTIDGVTSDTTLVIEGLAEPDSLVSVTASNVGLLGQVSATATGSWSLASQLELPEGNYSLTAVASNASGDSEPSSPFSVLIDTTAPAPPAITSIERDTGESDADRITNDRTLTIAGTAEPAANVQLTDGNSGQSWQTQTDGAGNWSVSFTNDPLPDGDYQWSAAAVDLAGNQSAPSNTVAVTIDTQAPSTPSLDPIQIDTGWFADDGITSAATQTLSGQGEPGSKVVLVDASVGNLSHAIVDASGDWSLTYTFEETAYSLSVFAYDLAGNMSGQSNSRSLVVDLTLPLNPTIAGFQQDTRFDDGITSDREPRIFGTAEPGTRVTLTESNLGEIDQIVAGADGVWSLDWPLAPLTDGSYTFVATSQDLSGNQSGDSASLSIVVDALAPTQPSIQLISDDTGISSSDGVTRDAAIQLAGVAESGSTITVTESSTGQIDSITTDSSGMWSLDLSGQIWDDGFYSWTAVAQDTAGNLSSPSSELSIELDTTAPAIAPVESIETDTGLPDDQVTSDATLLFAGTGQPGSFVTLYESTLGNLGTATVDTTGQWSIDRTSDPLVDGSYSFWTTASDAAGNVSLPSPTLDVTVDSTGPAKPSIVRIDQDSGLSDTDGTTNDSTLVLTGMAPAGSTVVVSETVLGQIGSAIASSAGTWMLDLTDQVLPDGTYEFRAVAQDTAGNSSLPSDPLSVTIDTLSPLAPTIESVFQDTGDSDSDGITADSQPALGGSAEPGTQLTILNQLGATVASTVVDVLGQWQIALPAALVDGTYQFTAFATDLAGNQSDDSVPLNLIIDTQAPAVPSILSITEDTGLAADDGITADNTLILNGVAVPGAMIVVTEPGLGFEGRVTADASGGWSINAELMMLDDGEYQFLAHAVDLAGNESAMTQPFEVVVDTLAPLVSEFDLDEASDTPPLEDQQTELVEVTLRGQTELAARVTLQETGQTTVAGPTGQFVFPGIQLAEGENSFTVRADDVAGNWSTRTQSITRTLPQVGRPEVVANLQNDTGTSDRDFLTTDPTLIGQVTHPIPVEVEFSIRSTVPGLYDLTADITSRLDVDGNFVLDRPFLQSMFGQPAVPFGEYRFTVIAVDGQGQTGIHHGELFVVPPGGDSPPIVTGIGLQNDTGPVATDRLSTDPTLVGFVQGVDITSVRLYIDSAGPGVFGDLTSQLDAAGNFVVDQAALEQILGGPLEPGFYAYHLEASDAAGNFAFKSSNFGFLASDDDDITPPQLTVSLQNDAGFDADDGVTNDLSLQGSVIDDSEVGLWLYFFNQNTFDEYEADVTDTLQADGSFVVSQSRLESIAGAGLTDGPYQFEIYATDRYTESFEIVRAQLDTLTPAVPVITGIVEDRGIANDGITSDNRLSFQGTAAPGSWVEVSESQLGWLGTAPVDFTGNWQVDVSGPGWIDGTYQVTAIARSRSGTPSTSSTAFGVQVDTDAPWRAEFGLAPGSDTGLVGDRITSQPVVTLVGTTSPGASVLLVESGQQTVADASGQFTITGVLLSPGEQQLTIETSDDAGNVMRARQRLTYDQPLILEDTSLVNQATRTISLDAAAGGSATLSFRIDADFGTSNGAFEDTLLVYLVDPANPDTTLIDRGQPGTSVFSLRGDRAEFQPGRVRFDGQRVDIDVSSLAVDDAQVRFQLIDHDGVQDSIVQVDQIQFRRNPVGVPSPVGSLPPVVQPGGSIDFSSLAPSSSDRVVVAETLRYDETSQEMTVRFQVRNEGPDLGQQIALRFESLPAGVAVLNPSGIDGGTPYVNLSTAVPSFGLLASASSDWVEVNFATASNSPLQVAPVVWDGGAPVAPVVDAVAPITINPGDVQQIQLTGTGADGFYFTWTPTAELPTMTLDANGLLTVAPHPDQLGNYQFDVVATDGIRSTSQTVQLNVVADPVTTSRISGYVLDTFSNPLPGIPVELGTVQATTDATGRFELVFPGAIPDGALKVHGEAYSGAEVYPFVAEKLPLLFGRDPFDFVNNTIIRPIYLPALDVANGVTIDPAQDVTVTTATIPGAAVFVQAGSLETQSGGMFTGELSITEVPADFTPAALPPEMFPDMVVTIQPGEMVFTTPAPLNLPNLAGYPAGTEMNLWSINPNTGLFDNVGLGIVSADGSVIETVSGGIINSSWHFFAANAADPVPAEDNPNNEEQECDPCSEQDLPNEPTQPGNEDAGEVDPASSHFQPNVPFRPGGMWSGTDNQLGSRASGQDFLDGLRQSNQQTSTSSRSNSSGSSSRRPATRYSVGSGNGNGGQLTMGSQLGPLSGATVTLGGNQQADSRPVVSSTSVNSNATSVSMHSGVIHKSHSLPGYQSLGAWRGLALHYDSQRADARPILSTALDGLANTPDGLTFVTRLTISRGDTQMVVPGYEGSGSGLTGGEHFFPIAPGSTSVDASLQADMNHLPTGVYHYEFSNRMVRTFDNVFVGTASMTGDRLIHVNNRDSEFGTGWSLAGLSRLFENPDGTLLMVNGDGGERLFDAPLNPGDPFVSPAEDFSTLVKLGDGSYRRTLVDQTVESFNSLGQLVAVEDRNGNRTEFGYNAESRIDSITDPVGLVTQFRYVEGRVHEIEDPAGRITRLNYQNDRLVSIEDADTSVRQFEYDSAGRLTGEIDKRGHREEVSFDFAGRVDSVTRNDGSVIDYDPVQTVNLNRPEVTRDPDSGTPAINYRSVAIARSTDANGNVRQVQLDKAGQRVVSNDGQGLQPQVERNENNLVRRVVDGRGNVTVMEYDERGNLISISDEVARQQRTLVPADAVESIALVDVNADGWLDLAVAQADFDEITIYFGDGAGGFSFAASYFGGFEPAQIQAGDFDGDGFIDLAVVNRADQWVRILLNDQLGGFDSQFVVDVPDAANLEVIDLEGDGDLDLLVGGFRQFASLVNQGDANFDVQTTNLSSLTGDNRLAAGDFDGDGWADVAVAAPDFSRNENQLEIFSGNGDGSFASTTDGFDLPGGTDAAVDWFVTDVQATDINGDGQLDLISTTPYTNQAITNNTSIAYGNGDGSFSPAESWTSGLDPRSIALGNFNDDGFLDFATANGQTGQVVVTVSQSDGSWNPETISLAADAGAGQVVVGDLDGDGLDELVVANLEAGNISVHFLKQAARTFEYDPVFNQLTRTVDELGREVIFEIDPVNGNTLSRTEVIGQLGGGDDLVTRYTYTTSGQLETIEDPLGRVTEHRYNNFGLLEQVTFALGQPEEATLAYEYDSAGNRSALIDELGHRTEFVYDALNRLVEIIEPDPDQAGPLASPVTTNAYDLQGNLVRSVDAENRETRFVYDSQNRLIETIDALGHSTRHQYDAAGNLIATIDRLDRRTEFVYDQRNRLVESLNAEGGRRLYQYDADDNLVALIDENGIRISYQYDARNRLVASTDALGGVSIWEYDAVDNLIATVDELGRRTEFEYDDVDRLIREALPDPDGDGPADSPTTQFEYDDAGNVLSVVDALGNATTMQYDARNRMIAMQQSDPDGSGPQTQPSWVYQYDDANRPVGVTDPLGRQTSWQYDALDRLIQETLPDPDGAGPEPSPTMTMMYDAVDNLVMETDALGNATVYQYDALDRLVQTTFADPDGSGPLLSPVVQWVLDAEGQRLQEIDPLGRTTLFVYDDLGRMQQRILPDPDGAGPFQMPVYQYEYDQVGNLVLAIDPLGNATFTEYDELYRMTRVREADPDGAGPLVSPVMRFQYDAADQMLAAVDALGRTTRYQYDLLGRRVETIQPAPEGDANFAVTVYQFDALGNLLATTDAEGNRTQFEYDNLYRLTTLIEADPDGSGSLTSPITQYEYDAAGQQTSITDPLGRVTRQTFDDLGRVILIQQPDPDGAGPQAIPETRYQYDSMGNLVAEIDALGNRSDFQYDNLYRLTMVALPDPDGVSGRATTQYQYDAAGQQISTTDAMGRTTLMAYDQLGRMVMQTRPDPDGAGPFLSPQRTSVFDLMNNLIEFTDAEGNTTNYVYDNLYRLTSVIQPDPDDAGPQSRPTTEYRYDAEDQLIVTIDPLGRQTSMEYDLLGRQVQRIAPDPDGAGPLTSPETFWTFDLVGNETSMTDAAGNVTQYRYDGLNRRIEMIESDPDGTGPLASPVTTMVYDAAGQLLSLTDPLGRTSSMEYDDLGRVIAQVQPDPDGSGPLMAPRTVYGYDLVGNQQLEIDPLGNHMVYDFDDLYRLTSEIGEDLDGTGPLGQPVKHYQYDLVGNLLSIEDSDGDRTQFHYDDLDRVFEESIELEGGQVAIRSFEYNLEDQLVAKTDRNNRRIEYELDRLYRTVAEHWFDVSDQLVNTLTFLFDEASQLLTTEDSGSSSRYELTYDGLGRLTQSIADHGGEVVELSVVLDSQGRRLQRSSVVGGVLDEQSTYQYDGLNRLTRMDQGPQAGGSAVAEKRIDFSYNAAGQLTEMLSFHSLAGAPAGQMLTAQRSYDGIGRLAELNYVAADGSTVEYAYQFDVASRILRLDHSIDGPTEYQYDPEDQLVLVDRNGSNDDAYEYDEDGNRTLVGYQTGVQNRLLSDGVYQYEYDAEGNRTHRTEIATGAVREYRWDHRNRLVEVIDRDAIGGPVTQLVQHRYDTYNRWVATSLDADGDGAANAEETQFFYDGDDLFLELNGDGSVGNRYLWKPGSNQLLAAETGNGDLFWAGVDHQGSVRDWFDATGLVNHRVYDAFGNLTSETDVLSGSPDRFGFTGRPVDGATGLQNHQHRWLDSLTGRWLSEDPIGFEAGDANLYRYVGNDVLNRVDLDGLDDGLLNMGVDLVREMGLAELRLGAGMYNVANRVLGLEEDLLGLGSATGYGGIDTPETQAKRVGVDPHSGPGQSYHIRNMIDDCGVERTRAFLERELEFAELSAHIYRGREGDLVGKYELAKIWEHGPSGFRAGLFRHTELEKFVLTFEGTNNKIYTWNSIADNFNNVWQGLGLQTTQYDFAVELAWRVKSHIAQKPGQQFFISGHSLGGGLGTLAGVVTGTETHVIDPAGVNQSTVARYGVDFSREKEFVTALRVEGEFLTTYQDTSVGSASIMPDSVSNLYTLPDKYAKGQSPIAAVIYHSSDGMVRNLTELLGRKYVPTSN